MFSIFIKNFDKETECTFSKFTEVTKEMAVLPCSAALTGWGLAQQEPLGEKVKS